MLDTLLPKCKLNIVALKIYSRPLADVPQKRDQTWRQKSFNFSIYTILPIVSQKGQTFNSKLLIYKYMKRTALIFAFLTIMIINSLLYNLV
jgi:hypothetical protein